MAFFKNLFKPAAPATPKVPELPWDPAASATPAAHTVPKVPKMQLPPVPAQLPKITAPTAADICKVSDPSPAAMELLTPQQTPPQYLNMLQDHQMGDDMVKTMAHGMPDREGVAWASQSAEKVSGSLPPADVYAMQAAKVWAANPTAENQAAAAAAAAKTDMTGPGALAAQGAAWAKPAAAVAAPAGLNAPAAPAASGASAGAAVVPRLTPMAVAGSVLLSAAIAANPKIAAPKSPSAPALKAPEIPQIPPAPQLPQIPPVPQIPEVAAPTPTVPPAVQAQTFKAQHPFIAAGLDIASGKTSV